MPYLVVQPSEGESFRITLEDRPLRVGRSQTSDICLSGDPAISRLHAEITPEGSGWMVKDLGSHNGTFIDDQPVTAPVPLRPGARIRVGRAVILFSGDAAATAPQPRIESPPEPAFDDANSIVLSASRFVTTFREETLHATATAPAERVGVQSRVFAVLSQATEALVGQQSLEEVLRLFLGLVFEAIRPDRGAIMLLEGDPPALRAGALRGMKADGDDLPVSRTVARLVLEGQQSVLTADAQMDPRLIASHSIGLQSVKSVMCVPLWNNRDVIGLVYADTVNLTRPFGRSDLEVLTLLANVAAVKIDNVRLFLRDQKMRELERELRAAAKIQRRLLPERLPEVPGYEIHGLNRPCLEVGGDYFDFILRNDGRLGVAIGDVAGKGMGAALLMATLQAALRAHASTDASPSQLVSRVNDLIFENSDADKFVTFFYGELDPATGSLCYVNAGHNPPLLIRRSGEVESLRTRGLILGFQRDLDYASLETTLEPGDLLTMFSDGVSESQNLAGEEFGEPRLLEVARRARGEGVQRVWQLIDGAVREFVGDAEPFDDFTLSLLKRVG